MQNVNIIIMRRKINSHPHSPRPLQKKKKKTLKCGLRLVGGGGGGVGAEEGGTVIPLVGYMPGIWEGSARSFLVSADDKIKG